MEVFLPQLTGGLFDLLPSSPAFPSLRPESNQFPSQRVVVHLSEPTCDWQFYFLPPPPPISPIQPLVSF